jgi:hypothetical protein
MSRLTRHEQADGDTQKSQRPFLQQVIAIPFEICYSRTSNFIHSLFSIPPLFHKLIVFTSLTMILVALLVVIIVPIVIATPPPPKKAAHLPDVDTFNKQNGSQWKIQYTGDIKFTGALGKLGLGGDKCRSSFLGGRHIWNCGDMMCGTWDKCGFSMGAAFYGTKSVSVINASAHSNVGDFTFASPWHGDPKPESPQSQYGMDTSNVVPINDTTGVAYIWEITRGAPDTPYANKGAGVVAVTLGATQPIATRVGPLLTGPDSVGLGIFAIIRDDRYIYNYNQQGPFGNILVGRVKAGDAAFDASKYEYLVFPPDSKTTPVWKRGIPTVDNVDQYGMRTAESNGRFVCQPYGSVIWSDYFQKYMLMCTLYLHYTFFYLAEKPWGPWTRGYNVLSGNSGWVGYGISAHPRYSAKDNELYFSQGPNGQLNMFKLTFHY